MSLGILIIRLVVGLGMAAHGSQKLFGWYGGPGLGGTGQFLETLGLRPGKSLATLVGVVEFGCGLLLAIGLLTPLVAAAIFADMLVAIRTVHLPKGFFSQDGGYELPLTISAVVVGLSFTGAGRFSLDHALHLGLSGLGTGFFALIVGAIGAAAALLVSGAGRQPARAP